jgi:hypothetical protein
MPWHVEPDVPELQPLFDLMDLIQLEPLVFKRLVLVPEPPVDSAVTDHRQSLHGRV